ncbi:alpha/beta fold hydrolase [Pseudoduganella sp. RAF53_2]|uniref:alpha/beta fold hydrolase n=1 Tax=unclassified Pseudoduganella TaxID=2637179 RepID=UPI003F9B7F89
MNKLIKSAFAAAALSAAALSPAAFAADPATVVLVHGAFADGSSWDKVIPLLEAKGLKVISVQNPLTSLADDVAATERAIAAQKGDVVLVGHSWAGTVITQAGATGKVKSLVYVAAFAPNEGESTASQGKGYPTPPGIGTLQADASGFVTIPEESVAQNFAQDLPAAQQKLIAATQGPIRGAAFDEKVTVAAWKTRPSYFIVTNNDRMIAPQLLKDSAKRIHAKTTVVESSHVAMLAQPEAVANVIIEAAQH